MRNRALLALLTAATSTGLFLIAGLGALGACTGDDPPFVVPQLTNDGSASDGSGPGVTDSSITTQDTGVSAGDSGVDAADASSFTMRVAAGQTLTCAIVRSGKVYCWGVNDVGQAGAVPGASVHTPHLVAGIESAIEVVVGSTHACALTKEQKVFCWGANERAQLGAPLDAGVMSAVPVLAQIPGPVIHIAASIDGGTCAVTTVGEVYCFGVNGSSELGVPANQVANLPTKVVAAADAGTTPIFTDIAMALGFTCATLPGDQSPWCWGDNAFDNLQRKNVSDNEPRQADKIVGFVGPLRLRLGGSHGCFHRPLAPPNVMQRDARCWGFNTSGVLTSAVPDSQTAHTPLIVPGLDGDIDELLTGVYATCGIFPDRTLRCAGSAEALGKQAITTTITDIGVTNVESASIGISHGCAVLKGATDAGASISCWGYNTEGQLGRGPTFDAGGVNAISPPGLVVGLP